MKDDAQTHKSLNIFGAHKMASLATPLAWIFRQKLSPIVVLLLTCTNCHCTLFAPKGLAMLHSSIGLVVRLDDQRRQ